jgi:hypothetical protein
LASARTGISLLVTCGARETIGAPGQEEVHTMTATQSETKSTSRRALLAGALGGFGALAASAIGRASPVRAANGNTVTVGGSFTGTTVTTITTTGDHAIWGESDNHAGIFGKSNSSLGVYGESTSYYGVQGFSSDFVGVRGSSATSDGVQGEANDPDHSGVYGSNPAFGYGVAGSTNGGSSRAGVWGHNSVDGVGVRGTTIAGSGVFGYSSSLTIPSAPAKVGVYGYANQDSSAKGIYGESAMGFAGYFAGRVYLSKYQEMAEISTPTAPGANKARLFVRDNGSGKTQLCVRFNTGGVLVIKTQP